MKGLNVKRIAAVGLGAALVGSALAPAVMAGVFNNLDQLKKTDVVDSTGMPVVDIVVGSMGQAPDVVWAGNIAAKVAQLATTPAAGAGPVTVGISVGGSQTTTGSGNTDENVLDFASGGAEFPPIKADYSDAKTFLNVAGRTIKNGNTDSQINIDENVVATVDVEVQTVADGIAAGDLVGKVNTNGIVYSLNLGTGLPYYNSLTQLDDNTQYNAKIPLFGKEYVVDEATSTKLVLYADTTAQTVEVGSSISVPGVGSYAGKTLTLSLDTLTLAGTAANYKAKWSLKDGTTVLTTKESTAPYELKDLFGTDYFTTSVYMSAAGLDASSNKFYATVRTGSERIEIRDSQVFPYDSTATTNPQWKAYIDASGTALTGSDGRIKKIQIKNNWAYNQTKTEGTSSKFALKAGDSIMLPSNYAKVSFKGLQTKAMAKATIGGESVLITDSKGVQRTLPLVIPLGTGSNTVTIAGSTYFMDVNTDANTTYGDGALRYWKKPTSTVAEPWNNPTGVSGTDYLNIGYTTKDVNTNTAVAFEVDADWKSGNVKYFFGGDETTSQFWLFLAAQAFDLDSKSDTYQSELVFGGTDIDQNAFTGTAVIPGFKADLNYYLPDSATYNVLTAERFTDWNSVSTAITSGNYTPTSGNDFQYVSLWKFNEGSSAVAGTSPATKDVNFYINNQDGSLVNSQDNKTRVSGATVQVSHADWTVSLDEHSTSASSKLTKGTTVYGSTVSVASGVATIMMPEETRKVEAYVGSNDTVTTTVGGESFTGVKAGETKTTTGGTKVTVDTVSASGAGVVVNKVGNIVKLDTAASYGKSIIVGGQLVNNMAKNLNVDGQTLDERLVAAGDYVAAVLTDGKIVVAGWTANDTGVAAQALITALDAFM